jgi:peptidoglycan/xylan/chitin deacetylase (PgdA/CDA1 family)
VLDILAQTRVRATFFVVGDRVGSGTSILRRARNEGHSVQNHSWSHANLTQLSDSGIHAQLTSTSNAIQSAIGARPRCYRPPYGATNPRVQPVAGSAGVYPEVLWNADTSDYQRPPPSTIVQRALANADGRGLIILLHDGGGPRGNTVAALRDIISGLKARGYQFVTLCN